MPPSAPTASQSRTAPCPADPAGCHPAHPGSPSSPFPHFPAGSSRLLLRCPIFPPSPAEPSAKNQLQSPSIFSVLSPCPPFRRLVAGQLQFGCIRDDSRRMRAPALHERPPVCGPFCFPPFRCKVCAAFRGIL